MGYSKNWRKNIFAALCYPPHLKRRKQSASPLPLLLQIEYDGPMPMGRIFSISSYTQVADTLDSALFVA